MHSILIAIPGLKIVTNMVANATNIECLATKNSGLASIMVTAFRYVDDQ